MNPGLGMGFVRFGTLAHHILVLIHEEGPQTNASISAQYGEAQAVAANIQRLLANGFLFVVGKDRPAVGRSHRVYGLTKPESQRGFLRRMTGAERSAKYRKRKPLRETNSIFNFRGSIPL